MSMKSCKDCGALISASAESCPKCGRFIRRRTSPVTWIVTGAVGIPLLIAIISGIVFSR
jgi:hypothetical protein